MSDLDIRLAGEQDLTLLAELNYALIREEGHRNPMSQGELRLRMRDWLLGDYQAYLFQAQGETIGYALFRPTSEYVYLRQFFIHSSFRRQGLGTAAFHRLIEKAWLPSSRIRVEALIENEVAITFWRSLGFHDYCLVMERG